MVFDFKEIEYYPLKSCGDIACQIILSKAPSKKYEKIARELDGENYLDDCFIIDSVATKENGKTILHPNWLLHYITDNGVHHILSCVGEVEGAWDFFKKKLGMDF